MSLLPQSNEDEHLLNVINTNTRPLRRLPDLQWSGGSRHSVCEYCSVQDNCSAVIDRPSVCNDTVPALSFQDETGLDDFANTVRMGLAWRDRLRKGDRVGLYNVKTQTVFGYARVTLVEGGRLGPMLHAHAAKNHLMLERPQTAARELCEWLRRNYGPKIVNPQSNLTAIYLQREPQQAAQADPEGQPAGS